MTVFFTTIPITSITMKYSLYTLHTEHSPHYSMAFFHWKQLVGKWFDHCCNWSIYQNNESNISQHSISIPQLRKMWTFHRQCDTALVILFLVDTIEYTIYKAFQFSQAANCLNISYQLFQVKLMSWCWLGLATYQHQTWGLEISTLIPNSNLQTLDEIWD